MKILRLPLVFLPPILTSTAFAQTYQPIDEFTSGMGELNGSPAQRYDLGTDILGGSRWTVLDSFPSGDPLSATIAPHDLTVNASPDVTSSLYLSYGMATTGPNDPIPANNFDLSDWDAIDLRFGRAQGDVQVEITLVEDDDLGTKTTYDTYLLPAKDDFHWLFLKEEFRSHNPSFDFSRVDGIGIQIFAGPKVSYSLAGSYLVQGVPEPASMAVLALGASYLFRLWHRTSRK